MKTVILPSGFRMAYHTYGTHGNIPMVFLHGLSVSGIAYRELLELLGQHGFYVVAPDAVDHGGSGSLPWGYTVADMADRVIELLDVLDIAHPVIAGHSMGGGMAVELAAAQPDRAQAVILLDAAAGREHHENIRRGSLMPLRAAQRLAAAFVDVLGDGYTAMRSRDAHGRLSLIQTMRQSVTSFRFVRAAHALMRADTGPLLEKMRLGGVPTAVIHGGRDQIIPWVAGYSAAVAADAQLYTIDDGFHSWMVAEPKEAARLITYAWFKAVSR